jgi:phosphatidate phosphatase APP1
MVHWKSVVGKLASNTDDYFDQLLMQYRRRTGRVRPLQIVPYRGFGNAREVYLRGRVLEDKNIPEPTDKDSVWRNMLSMYQRFNSQEVPGIQVQLLLGENSQIVTTDREGYFEFRMPVTAPLPGTRAWHKAEVKLIEPFVADQVNLSATGHILVPPATSRFGVISDVDDTILVSGVTNLLRMARLAFLNNARTRLPFAGVSAFYRALQSGPESTLFNPVFYVSSSPWNLYDLLADFCAVQGIPKGPLMLRDIGIDEDKVLSGTHAGHKTIQIEHIMRVCSDLPFVLIGDSGQHDPEIYLQVLKDYPDRVMAIYIREVTRQRRRQQVLQLAEEAKALNVPLLLVEDTVEAAEHAVGLGLIDPDAIPDIRADKRYDEEVPSDIEQLMEE